MTGLHFLRLSECCQLCLWHHLEPEPECNRTNRTQHQKRYQKRLRQISTSQSCCKHKTNTHCFKTQHLSLLCMLPNNKAVSYVSDRMVDTDVLLEESASTPNNVSSGETVTVPVVLLRGDQPCTNVPEPFSQLRAAHQELELDFISLWAE